MIHSLDPFALEFDSIELDPDRAPLATATDPALALAAPTAASPEAETRPGFYLLNDAHGRFVVDHEIGVISMKDEDLIESERGAVYTVRLRVVEPSGARYDIDMPLRITGRVPQLVGGEQLTFPAEMPPRTSVRAVAPPSVPWSAFAAHRGVGGPTSLGVCGAAPYGGVLQTSLPETDLSFVSLALAEQAPPPAPTNAVWAI